MRVTLPRRDICNRLSPMCQRFCSRVRVLVLVSCICVPLAAGYSLVSSAWEEAVYQAAEAAVQAVRAQSGAELSLREVPLDTLRVYHGRQSQLGLSIDGIHYEFMLGSDQEFGRLYEKEKEAAQALPAAQQAQPSPEGDGPQVLSGLVHQHWQAQGTPGAPRTLTLPDVTLSGPLELVMARGATPVTFFTPHAVDMGPVGTVRLAAGVNVKVSGLRSIGLRRTLDLPNLPVGFLAEVYAHAKLKESGEGFENAPGIHYLAAHLRAAALNSSFPLLSLELVPADDSLGLVISGSAEVPMQPIPRLKVKADKLGGVELILRQGELTISRDPSNVLHRSSALARPWAWPLPHVDLSSLVPLEAVLRSILAAHPFDLGKVHHQGISMKLVKTEITGTRLMAFEMEVRSHGPSPLVTQAGAGVEQLYDDVSGFREEGDQLMVFDVVVSVKEKAPKAMDGAGGPLAPHDFVYVPVSVRLKEVHGATLSMTQGTMMAMLARGNNQTVPMVGFDDHQDLGVARREAE